MSEVGRRDYATPIIYAAYGIALTGAAVVIGRGLLKRAAGGAGFGGKLKSVIGPHQLGFVVKNAHRPWLVGAASEASRQAHHATTELFGAGRHIDDVGDAFRHAFASGMLASSAHAHGLSPEKASALAVAAGRAHELDGAFNPHALSSLMDDFNNAVGSLLPFGGGNKGIDPLALRGSVLDAIRGGALRVIEDGKLVASTLPAHLVA